MAPNSQALFRKLHIQPLSDVIIGASRNTTLGHHIYLMNQINH